MEKINFENSPSTTTPLNANNLNQLQTNVEDAINNAIERGSNDNGNYIKYSDGTMICTKKISYSASTDFSQDGSLYYKNVSIGNFPVEFIETPTVNVLNEQSNGTRRIWLGGAFGVSANGIEQVIICALWNAIDAGGILHVQAIGKWK